MDELVAEVFGGISKGGDGIVIFGGKLKRIPPRGIKIKLFEKLVSFLDAGNNPRKIAEIGKAIEKLGKEIAGGK